MEMIYCWTLFALIWNVHVIKGYQINFGSCSDVNKSLAIFEKISERKPDFWIYGGDNIYADYRPNSIKELVHVLWNDIQFVKDHFPKPPFFPAFPAKLRFLYEKLASDPYYSRFVETVGQENIAAIWDDHDYGQNDYGARYPYRKESQEEFLRFFKVPKTDPRWSQEGIFSFVDTDNGNIRIILLDNRYHRDEYSNKSGDFLGETQWKWLEETLKSSNAKVNIIVSGLQVLPDEFTRSKLEAWSKFPVSRQRLLDTISASQAAGVLLISGDVHFSEIMQAVCQCDNDIMYALPEITSSGLTHSWATYPSVASWIMETHMAMVPTQYQLPNQYYLGKNFGELNIVGNMILAQVLDDEGQVRLKNRFYTEMLKPRGELKNCQCSPYLGRMSELEQLPQVVAWAVVLLLPLIALFTVVLLPCRILCRPHRKAKRKAD